MGHEGIDLRQRRYRYIRPAITASTVLSARDDSAKKRAANVQSIVFYHPPLSGQERIPYAVRQGELVPSENGIWKPVVGASSQRAVRQLAAAEVKVPGSPLNLIRFGEGSLNSYTGGNRDCVIKLNFHGQSGRSRPAPDAGTLLSYIAREEAACLTSPDCVNRDFPIFGPNGLYSTEEAIQALGNDQFFTMIISPADRYSDLEEITRRFLEESVFPACSARPRTFFACRHYNTAHPHVHVVISREPADPSVHGLIHLNGSYIRGRMRRELSSILTDATGKDTVISRAGREAERNRLESIGEEDEIIVMRSNAGPDGSPVFRYSSVPERMLPQVRAKINALKRRKLVKDEISTDAKGIRDYAFRIDPVHARRTVRALAARLFSMDDLTENLTADNFTAGEDYSGTITATAVAMDRRFFLIRDDAGQMHVWFEKEGRSPAAVTEGRTRVDRISDRLSFRNRIRS